MKTIGEIFKIAIICSVIVFNIPYMAVSQSVFQLNGKTILQDANNLYDITTSDTLKIDQKNIIIEFKQGQAETGLGKVTSNIGLQKVKNYTNLKALFKIPTNSDFIATINTLLGFDEINIVSWGYILTAGITGSSLRNSGIQNSGSQNNSPNVIAPYPNDQHDGDWWELVKTNVTPGTSTPVAWSYSVGDPSIKVAIIDNGLVWSDPDFTVPQPIAWDFFNGDSDVTPDIPIGNDIEIGTAIASIIAGRTANEYGLCGIAGGYYSNGLSQPPVTLLTYQAMTDNYNEISTLAVAASINEAILQNARIIHLGFGLNYVDYEINEAIQAAHNAGIIIFAPTGEGATSSTIIDWPARNPNVIAVGGTDIYDKLAKWYHLGQIQSKTGNDTELSLPAENIEIVDVYGPNGNTYGSAFASTTNISSAMATGIAALMLSVNPCLSAEEVRTILRQSCEKVGGYSYNSSDWCTELGYGRVNANTAVELAMGEPGKTLTINETSCNYNRSFRGDIIVPNGKTLTLQNMTLKMWGICRNYCEKRGYSQYY